MTSIISYTELLSQEPLEPPASEYVQIMAEKAQRLKAMVQDVFHSFRWRSRVQTITTQARAMGVSANASHHSGRL